MIRAFSFIGIVLSSMNCIGQFSYEVRSTPDSAEVTMNGELKCYTPCKVNYYWFQKEDGIIKFAVNAPNYKEEEFIFSKKPIDFEKYSFFDLELKYPVVDIEKPALIAFDKLRVSIADGKKVGEKHYLKKPTENIEWQGRIKVGDESFEESFYEIATNMGLSTVVSESSELFSQDNSSQNRLPRYIVGAEILGFNVRYQETKSKVTRAGKMKGKTTIKFNWQVLDKKSGKIVLSLNNSAEFSFRQSNYQELTYILDVYELGLMNFLNDEEFLNLLKSGKGNYNDTSSVAVVLKDKITIQQVDIEKFNEQSEMIDEVRKACVSVSTDGGHGSGAIISEDGYILTAYHVIEGVNKIEVHFANGMKLPASIERVDEENDVAIIKIPGNGYRALPLFMGKDYGLGIDVLTIGTPYDLELGQSISKGILSGKRRNEGQIYLQLDMAVSPGNSGGPLLNSKGEILGVVQRKIVDTGIEGIGFAIPVDHLIEVLNIEVEN